MNIGKFLNLIMSKFSYVIVSRQCFILTAVFCVVVVTAIAYGLCLKGSFTLWDDPCYVTENPLIKDFSFVSAKKIATSFHRHLYKPLVFLSFALEYHFFKLNPFGYHMVSLLLHVINSLLVFWLVFIISRSAAVSFFTALLFGVHPLHVESVAWIAERKDLLYALFFLLALIFYLLFKRLRLKRFYVFSLLFFILSLLAKPQGIIFPFLLFLFDWRESLKWARGEIIEKIPYFLLAASAGFLNFYGLRSSLAAGETLSFSFDGVLVACHGIFFYLGKIFIPFGLSCFYPYPQKAGGFLPFGYLVSPLALIFLVFFVFSTGRHTKKIIFGSLFFLLTLMPVLPLAPFSPGISAADSYSYIPSIGIFYLAAGFFVFAYNCFFEKRRVFKIIGVLLLRGLFGLLSFLTFRRAGVWKDDVALWSDAIKTYPRVSTAHLNLASAYLARGGDENALSHAGEALRLDPYAWDVYLLLGNIYSFRKDYDKALSFYLKASRLRPGESKIYNNIGRLYYLKGADNWDVAIGFYKKAILMNPQFYGPYYSYR